MNINYRERLHRRAKRSGKPSLYQAPHIGAIFNWFGIWLKHGHFSDLGGQETCFFCGQEQREKTCDQASNTGDKVFVDWEHPACKGKRKILAERFTGLFEIAHPLMLRKIKVSGLGGELTAGGGPLWGEEKGALSLFTIGRVLLRLFRNRITRNRRYSCSFESYSVHSAPDSRSNERNERNTVYSKYGEYAFGRRSPGFRLEDVIVLKSPLPWVFRFQNEWPFFWKLKFRVFCYS